MLSLDLFDSKYEKKLHEGAVDKLEQRRIDDLAMKMDDLVARAKQAKDPAHKAALVKEFQKCKDERDSYYKIKEAGIPGSVPVEKIPGKEDLLKGKGRSYYESVEEGNPSKKVFKDKAGKPVGEIGIDPDTSPGNGEWYVYHYGTGYSVVGFDNAAEAKRELMYVHKHPEAVEGHESTFNEAGIPGSVPADKIPGKEDLLKGRGRSYYESAQKKNSKSPLNQRLNRLKVQARREFPQVNSDEEALLLKLLDKETQDDRSNRQTDARQDAELKRNFSLDLDQEDEIKDLQLQTGVHEHGGGIGPRQHWQDLMPEQSNTDDDWYDDDEPETDLRSGDYVRDTMDGEHGEIFRMQGDPYERRVRILDRDDRGWYIEPSRLTRVDPQDPDVQRYFGKKRVRDMDESGVAEASFTAAASMHAATRKRDPQRQEPKHDFRVGDNVVTKKGKKPGEVVFVDGEKIHVKGTNPYYPNEVTYHTASELKKDVAEGDDLGHLDAEVFGRIDKEKQRRADLKKNDPAAYAREMEKDKKNYGRGIMGALRRKYDQPLDEEGVAEGLPQTLRKVVPGHAKREIDKKMDAGKFGKTDADKDANFQRYKKIQDKLKEQGVAEGSEHNVGDTVNYSTKVAGFSKSAQGGQGKITKKTATHYTINGKEMPHGHVKSKSKGVSEGQEESFTIDGDTFKVGTKVFNKRESDDAPVSVIVRILNDHQVLVKEGGLARYTVWEIKDLFYADDADFDDGYDDEEIPEGWSDKYGGVMRPPTPYSVYIKGKKWKDFATDDHARAVMDKLKAKFKADGRDPETITIAPTNMSEDLIEGIRDTASATAVIACLLTGGSLSGCATAPQQTSAQQVLKTGQDLGRTVQTAQRITRAGVEAEVNQEIRNLLRGVSGRPEELNHSNILRIWKKIKGAAPTQQEPQNEAKEILTKQDFVKERDRLLRMISLETNSANKQILRSAIRQLESRAENEGWITIQQRMVREDNSSKAAEQAIIKRIMVAHTDLLQQFGPEKVMQAAEEVAYNVGDLGEIGSSDVSGWVKQVKQILGATA